MTLIPDFDLVLGGVPRFAAEAPWAWRLVKRLSRPLPCRNKTEVYGHQPTVGEAAGKAAAVLVWVDPEAYLLPSAALRLVKGLANGQKDLILPVTNEPWCEEARGAPAFAYHTPALLAEVVECMATGAAPPRPVRSPRSPVFAIRRAVLASVPSGMALDAVPEEIGRRGGRAHVDPGAYLHRYGEMDGQARLDLVARVPPGARSVLDVGCSKGGTAAALRQAGAVRLVGIEPDAADAAEASRLYDRVLPAALEQIAEEFPSEFDAILFGDVLEHLIDPAAALARVRSWLTPNGVVIASVPNLGHWSVVADLLEGRFEYIPYSILSGTHIRFFTRRTLCDLFEASGYRVEAIDTVTLPPTPAGATTLARLASFPGASEDLRAAEFITVARPADARAEN